MAQFHRSHLSRRAFLGGAIVAALVCRPDHAMAQAGAPTTTVTTQSGVLSGLVSDNVRMFRGVPFAEPPIGPLRFKPPVAVEPWAGVRDATAFAAAAPQAGYVSVPHSEDCLYLNVWAPEGAGPFPVLVWIHGGGFTGGYAFDPEIKGVAFAQAGIIVVSVAYRLGAFGFLDLGGLLGDEYSGSANNGIRDVIAALKWIHENIESFGGDPTKVTVGGQSAGAKLTDIILGIPSATPLFQQAISESGGAERVASKESALEVATGFGSVWSRSSSSDVKSLLTAPRQTIIEAQSKFIEAWPQHFPLRCELGDQLIAELPVKSISLGSARGKRLLIGTNQDESAFFDGPAEVRDVTARDLGNIPLVQFQTVFKQYQSIYPTFDPKHLRVRALTAEEYWVPSTRVADAFVEGGGNAWMYRLDFTEDSGELAGFAYHSLELGMVWDRPHKHVSNALAEENLGTSVHQAWISFIRGSSPAAPSLPQWPAYSDKQRSTMILDTVSRVEDLPQNDELSLWDGVM